MGDNSEYRLLSISIRKPPKYGSFLSKDSTQRQNFLTHDVQKDETLQGIALKYGVTMEKIKRANNLWTSDSLFLRPTLSIPIDKKPSDQENGLNDNDSQSSELNGYHKTSTYLNGNSSNSVNSNSSATTTNSSTNVSEHNNNLDYKISLNEITPELDVKPSTSSQNLNQNALTSSELRKDESMDDFLFRIDQYIKQSKVKMDSFATSSEIISSQSDDDLFKLHNYGYPKKSLNYRQRSLHNNDICLHEIRDKNNHENREIIYSLRKLEKEQEEREKFEL